MSCSCSFVTYPVMLDFDDRHAPIGFYVFDLNLKLYNYNSIQVNL